MISTSNWNILSLIYQLPSSKTCNKFRKGILDAGLRKKIFAQIVSAVYCLHSADLVHRDLKPANVLINSRGDVKLCDFGQARKINDRSRKLSIDVSTRWFKPP